MYSSISISVNWLRSFSCFSVWLALMRSSSRRLDAISSVSWLPERILRPNVSKGRRRFALSKAFSTPDTAARMPVWMAAVSMLSRETSIPAWSWACSSSFLVRSASDAVFLRNTRQREHVLGHVLQDHAEVQGVCTAAGVQGVCQGVPPPQDDDRNRLCFAMRTAF